MLSLYCVLGVGRPHPSPPTDHTGLTPDAHLSLLHSDLPPVSQPELIKSEQKHHEQLADSHTRADLFPPPPPHPDMTSRLPGPDTSRLHMEPPRMGLDLLAPRYQGIGDLRLPEPRHMLPSSPSFSLQPTSNSNLAILEQSRSLTTLSMAPTTHSYPLMSPHGFFSSVSPTSLTSSYLTSSPSAAAGGLPSSFLYPQLYGGSGNQGMQQTSNLQFGGTANNNITPAHPQNPTGAADTRFDMLTTQQTDRRSADPNVTRGRLPEDANMTARGAPNGNKDLGILTTRDPNSTTNQLQPVSHHHDNGDSVWRPY